MRQIGGLRAGPNVRVGIPDIESNRTNGRLAGSEDDVTLACLDLDCHVEGA